MGRGGKDPILEGTLPFFALFSFFWKGWGKPPLFGRSGCPPLPSCHLGRGVILKGGKIQFLRGSSLFRPLFLLFFGRGGKIHDLRTVAHPLVPVAKYLEARGGNNDRKGWGYCILRGKSPYFTLLSLFSFFLSVFPSFPPLFLLFSLFFSLFHYHPEIKGGQRKSKGGNCPLAPPLRTPMDMRHYEAC